jgi:hypothetical protein
MQKNEYREEQEALSKEIKQIIEANKEGNLERFLPFNNKLVQDDWYTPINSIQLYLNLYGQIPNVVSIRGIKAVKSREWFEENYAQEILDSHQAQDFKSSTKKFNETQRIYILQNKIIIDISSRNGMVVCFFPENQREKAEKIIKGFSKFKERLIRSKPTISIIVNSSMGLDTKCIDVVAPSLSIEDNYNDDFLPIHQVILKRLSKKNDKGLVLLHGSPGTGKTSYIRYLISKVKKNIIFLPPQLASSLTNPDLISLILDNTNSIFVIEDAENLITSRESNEYSPVSTLLNLTDGLLSDSLSIQIICTFNTDISRIDKALLRKGRLIAKYEFRPLEVEKAQKLADKLKLNKKIQKPTTLTEIYNNEEIVFAESYTENKRIGFYTQ